MLSLSSKKFNKDKVEQNISNNESLLLNVTNSNYQCIVITECKYINKVKNRDGHYRIVWYSRIILNFFFKSRILNPNFLTIPILYLSR